LGSLILGFLLRGGLVVADDDDAAAASAEVASFVVRSENGGIPSRESVVDTERLRFFDGRF